MSETRVLLGKIQALRQRLEQAQGLANEARTAAAVLVEETAAAGQRLVSFERLVEEGDEHNTHLDHLIRPLTGDNVPLPLPRQLTSRARRVLERGRELLLRLRQLADAFDPSEASESATSSLFPRHDPLAKLYRETVALTDTALRMIPLFPDTTSAQLRLCEGLEAILNVVASRLLTLTAGVDRQRQEAGRVSCLAELLTALDTGRSIDKQPFLALAEEILQDAQECGPLRFLEGDPRRPAHFIACHSLTTARVLGRIIRHDPELRGRAMDALLAALVHDAGMLRVPPEILAHPGPLDDEQRRVVEAHCSIGVSLIAPLLLDSPWLAEVVSGHHERLDGTGYPDGLRDFQIKPLTRLLAVCDVYAGFCTRREYRPARETRTALTDTLLLAEQGQLDRHYAECLLHLSFYPIGSVVELADGAVGVVVATPQPRRDLSSPARPVVALLTDSQGRPLPLPHHVDLAQCDSPSIVRTLSSVESRDLLGARFPEWV
ncbi:MAG TPA: HD domain-containing phosphohydrolase [Gemmataceae bacterium]|nr:HD domain-containing phosphohydrolase [Gemmataceae bacterium]